MGRGSVAVTSICQEGGVGQPLVRKRRLQTASRILTRTRARAPQDWLSCPRPGVWVGQGRRRQLQPTLAGQAHCGTKVRADFWEGGKAGI